MTPGASGRVLLRITPRLHQQSIDSAKKAGLSLNDFITQCIKERVEQDMAIDFERVVIGEKKISEVREATIVTQHPWFMELLHRYKIYFFNPNLGRVTPMQYLLFYETTKQDDNGFNNQNPRHIANWGRVKEILFGIATTADLFRQIPELKSLADDPVFWPEVSTWGTTNAVILEEVGKFDDPIPLDNGYEARYLVNKTTSLARVRNAKIIEDLYKQR